MVIILYNTTCLFYSYDEHKYEQINTGWVVTRVNKGPRGGTSIVLYCTMYLRVLLFQSTDDAVLLAR